ncbi:MAG: tetratricopeptide repeat protein [Phycisphaerae bacterium]|nr:tetratricopeptide repeat protein [Phycisphaerae bacterium]
MPTPDQLIREAASARAAGRLDQAASLLRAALDQDPRHADARQWAGAIAAQAGRYAEAVEHLRVAAEQRPGDPGLHANLGMMCSAAGDLPGSEAALRRAVEIKPDFADALACLGVLMSNQQRMTEAEPVLRRAADLAPASASVVYPLVRLLAETGRADEAVETIRRAQRQTPADLLLQDKLCMLLNYLPGVDPAEHLREHRRYGQLAPRPAFRFDDRDRDQGRRLRVGYLSADLREHSVAYYLEPLLTHHDRAAVEVFCYHVGVADQTGTPRLAALADHFRQLFPATDTQVIEVIRSDAIDILVELGGHTSSSRLPIAAVGPAPIGVSYIGYPNTTGVPAIHYRLVDALTDPPGAERYATEQLVWLPGCFLCYRPPPSAPEPAPPPADATGVVTFASFNNLAKLSGVTIDLWARVLAAVPGSRLLLKGKGLNDALVSGRILSRLAAGGIAADRVRLAGHTPSTREHLEAYAHADIALDPFPYHGTTTTCEAMWMGVPVVSLVGEVHASRVGLSLLSAVGLPDLAAGSADEFVRTATALAGDAPRRRTLRTGLRAMVAASRLCDGVSHARAVEAAYRQMWVRWCEGHASGGDAPSSGSGSGGAG